MRHFCINATATLEYPVPAPVSRDYLFLDSLPDDASPGRLLCAAIYLIDQGKHDRLESLVRRLRASVDTTAGNGVTPGQLEAIVDELRGYRALEAGDLERAADLLSRSNEAGAAGAIWRGDLQRKLGHLDRAEGWYRAAWRHPLSYERLGRLYERTGDTAQAVTSYRRFVAGWDEADGPLQAKVRRVRGRIRELGASL